MSDHQLPGASYNESHSTGRDRFFTGSEDLLAAVDDPGTILTSESRVTSPSDVLAEIRIRIGTLLKTENVAVLFGAGASKDCGGPLIGSIPIELERRLHQAAIRGSSRPTVRRWLPVFYLAAERSGNNVGAPLGRSAILRRVSDVEDDSAEPLKANLEAVLGLLHRWLAVMDGTCQWLRLEGAPPVNISRSATADCIQHLTTALTKLCELPVPGKEACLSTYSLFLRKILTRPLNLKRANIFTLNYDTLVEQAADGEGIVLLDGFVGTNRRIFRPECYDQDLYFPAETTEGRVHRFDRVLHLYKLHGSITWRAKQATIDNPYGVESERIDEESATNVLVYPTPLKYAETLGMPYAELFRRFASSIVRPQSALFVIGYGFGDDHVNTIIRQALALPSFTIVIVDPSPTSEFVAQLRSQDDRRVWIVEGMGIGTFNGFSTHILPDLRDEDIRKKVHETQSALSRSRSNGPEVPDVE